MRRSLLTFASFSNICILILFHLFPRIFRFDCLGGTLYLSFIRRFVVAFLKIPHVISTWQGPRNPIPAPLLTNHSPSHIQRFRNRCWNFLCALTTKYPLIRQIKNISCNRFFCNPALNLILNRNR